MPRYYLLIEDQRFKADSYSIRATEPPTDIESDFEYQFRLRPIDFESAVNSSSDLVVLEYKTYLQLRDELEEYVVIYDSGEKGYPYYYYLAQNLSECRISCRNIILEKR